MRIYGFVIVLCVFISCSGKGNITTDKGKCKNKLKSLSTVWKKDSINVGNTEFFNMFDSVYSKCFLMQDTTYLISALGRKFNYTIPIANKNLIDSLQIIKAVEYQVKIVNNKDYSNLLFMIDSNGIVKYYRRIWISEGVIKDYIH